MKLSKNHIKDGLFIIVILGLFLPLLQSNFKWVEIAQLNGAIYKSKPPEITWDKWATGEFQNLAEKYTKDHYGFYPTMIRLYNQSNYSLFNKTTAKSVIIGKDGFLYEENYIKAYFGENYIGFDSIRKQVDKLNVIADSLQQFDTKIVVLLAPGKGSFYPNHFPKKYNKWENDTTNYQLYKQLLAESDVTLFDAKYWFSSIKDSINKKHKLFSKTGVHWSMYGEYLVADSLLSLFETLTDKRLPKIVLDSIVYSKKLRGRDNDLWKGMNLFFPIADFTMSYPTFHREDSKYNTTKVLTIADSYFWGMYNFGFSRDYLSNGEFWYYYNVIYPKSFDEKLLVSQLDDVWERLKTNDIVLIICTDANLNRFGFNFLSLGER